MDTLTFGSNDTGATDSAPADSSSGKSIWDLALGGLNVYKDLEAQKLQNRLALAQTQQLATVKALEQQSNINAKTGALPIGNTSLSFDPKIFLWVVGGGLVLIGLYAAVRG
jgi:hypothetical protein